MDLDGTWLKAYISPSCQQAFEVEKSMSHMDKALRAAQVSGREVQQQHASYNFKFEDWIVTQYIASHQRDLLFKDELFALLDEEYNHCVSVKEEEQKEFASILGSIVSVGRGWFARESESLSAIETEQRRHLMLEYIDFFKFAATNEPIWRGQAKFREKCMRIEGDARVEKEKMANEERDYVLCLKFELDDNMEMLKMKSANEASSRMQNSGVRLENGSLLCVGAEVKNIDSLPSYVLAQAPSIVEVNFSSNALTATSLQQLRYFQNVNTLILDNNRINSIVYLPSLPNLHRLWLNNNQLEKLEEILNVINRCCPRLVYLSLLNNPCAPHAMMGVGSSEAAQYRIHVKAQLPNLLNLDATPFTQQEAEEARKKKEGSAVRSSHNYATPSFAEVPPQLGINPVISSNSSPKMYTSQPGALPFGYVPMDASTERIPPQGYPPPQGPYKNPYQRR